MVLVDTSVWIDVFRPDGLVLEHYVPFDEVATCLPIIQEVLQGFRREDAFRKAYTSLFALPLLEAPLEADLFVHAAQLYRTGRSAGFTIRSSVDCLIAACAIRHGIQVLHNDRDFDAIAKFSPLEARNVVM
ncbi:MAG TPA: PIN domain-containing protein [Thermoanaerobaculia bacterium]|nr:PIN domain-containing protein [Thermoanaerobaculia bacterium]